MKYIHILDIDWLIPEYIYIYMCVFDVNDLPGQLHIPGQNVEVMLLCTHTEAVCVVLR